MPAQTSASRPKIIGFTAGSDFSEKAAFSVVLRNSSGTIREVLTTDAQSKILQLGSKKNGTFDMAWFSAWDIGDTVQIMFSGYAYASSVKLTLTAATAGAQKITTSATAISGVTTTLPGVNL